MPNALAGETSPYLLQHKDNPVDWMPWGDAAFARARDEDKPLLVSIGYSACHWCHVMERESFENESIAALMNKLYVCVKVDREERPDVDAIYMDAVQAMTGQGGWPLNAFLLPDGLPFFCGTYFPPEPRGQMASWPMVLEGVAEAYREKRDEIEQTRGQLLGRLVGAAGIDGRAGELGESLITDAVGKIRLTYDGTHGGFGGAPKFPQASVIEFLLGQGEREMSIHTLRAMANGGLYDQIGGGFSRYTVDAAWVVPHFEKMLYDNALLARAYLHGWQATGDVLLRRVCEGTLDFMLRELRQEEGGFASALDADSEGVEGKFYVWTLDEVSDALGEDADEAIRVFGMTQAGNFEGRNIPVRAASDPPNLAELKARLLAAREQRVRPGLDDKRLTAWNALAIAAFADAGAVFGREDYLEAARAAAAFVLDTMRDADGRLLRTFNRGEARLAGYLEDYGYLLEALLTLYEATFEERWFAAARDIADRTIAGFYDSERGGFFTTADDHEALLVRRKSVEDSPIPAGQSAAAYGLLRLGALTGDRAYVAAAETVIRPLGESVSRYPAALGHVLQAMAFSRGPVREVALVGDPGAFLEVFRAEHRPLTVIAAGDGAGGVPLLEGRTAPGAYVCEGFVCQAPTTSAEELQRMLK
jgi:uncharacterized protein YyaL (SSP411 family)